jgi:hypothetical protein
MRGILKRYPLFVPGTLTAILLVIVGTCFSMMKPDESGYPAGSPGSDEWHWCHALYERAHSFTDTLAVAKTPSGDGFLSPRYCGEYEGRP